MTNEVFSWNAASNNQGLVAGKMSYIVNSISAWRTAQGTNPAVADDTFFVPALRGPEGGRSPPSTSCTTGSFPSTPQDADAAKEFLLHYTANFASATYHSKLYDFWPGRSSTPEPQRLAGQRPVRGQARRQAQVPDGRDEVEHQHRPSRARPTPRSARSSARSSSPTCSPGPPAARSAQAGGRRRRGPDQADLRQVARPGPGGGWLRCSDGGRRGPRADQGFDGGQGPRDRRRRPGHRGGGVPRPARAVRAAARPRCCARSPGWSSRPRARCTSTASVVNGLPPRARQVAMVLQCYALYPHKTVRDNIVFPLKAAEHAAPPARTQGHAGRPSCWASRTCWAASHGSCPAASASGSRWPARWSANRRCSCSTSRCPAWTRSCAPAPATS